MTTSTFTYYPFAPVCLLTAARYTFASKERDEESGLSYFGSRYYSSDLSIWLSVDPMSDKYPSLSPYVYCANDPVKLVDPNGEEIDLETIYKKDANGNNTSIIERYNIKISGKIFNNSSVKIDEAKAQEQISNQIEQSFSGETLNGIPVSVTTDFKVVSSLKQVSKEDHLILLDNDVTINGHQVYGRVNKIGGHIAHIDAHLFKGPYDVLNQTGAKAVAHEVGHFFGLRHSSASGLNNLMRSPRLGTNISSDQLSKMIKILKNDQCVSSPNLQLINQY